MIYDISYKTFMGAKLLRIRFDKLDGVIKIYDEIRYLELFGCRIYNAIYDRNFYLISENGDVKYIINHNFVRIRIDSYNLPIEKALTFHNVTIFFKSVVNKNKNIFRKRFV